MGNEQSHGGEAPAGVSSTFSFLSRRRGSIHKHSPIVVVNSMGHPVGDPKDDEDLKKLKEIPRFNPLLLGVLPGQRDSPSIFNKVDPKYIARFVHRLQQHFSACHKAVSSNQTQLINEITNADQKTSALLRRVSLCSKKYESFTNDLKRVELLDNQLNDVQRQLNDLLTGMQSLNLLLKESDRLPELPLLANDKPSWNQLP
ncbi:unnamed protein product [Bursaphelenchus xylophilus]|uniref:BLOC-1-related complex subunit 5 n=1 Tax=Bursaphelenchus xylophilus TaxID=6326 RepID=A0A1I7RPP2_BURXY|nr:unnamed protein product [Bursaphelenchus xylophilus]CAG9096380.1 unnamed protein product [Bursaphelenchus xylophilus]